MKILGISAGFHDAAVSVIQDGKILFAAHSERYSKKKHDSTLNLELLTEALHYGYGAPDVVAYYEKPWLKKTRQLYAGQYKDAVAMHDITIKRYLNNQFSDLHFLPHTKFKHFSHHLSHAAGAFQTSTFSKATCIIIDAIGEWDTISILGADYDENGNARYKTLWKQRYPHSIGLMYSAMTKKIGLTPLDEEYILMGMAAYGKPKFTEQFSDEIVSSDIDLTFTQNMHAGVELQYIDNQDMDLIEFDVAASAQKLAEILIDSVLRKAQDFNWSSNLVYSGGVALNCTANCMLGHYFENIWIMPNPGDAGSSLGAAALSYGKKLDWQGPYLGTDILGPYPVKQLMNELLINKIVGVANGKAEFGPRALGNRSLLADPRGDEIKDKVNEIKRRQKFRPFAPVILEEYVHEYFEMPTAFSTSPYMQVIAKCKHPDLFPAIIHVDGTSRVQTVAKDCKSGIRQLLEEWYAQTGCPMLLNTSLNIRGEPMVDNISDAKRFEQTYNVRVFS
jgi:carbamoyltransferase